ncbi:MAG: flagellar basal body P-ring formation chaperone FlgA [Bdellovibrionota bacterium]
MKLKLKKLKNLFLYLFFLCTALSLNPSAYAYDIYIRGRQEVTITKPIVTLSDIASIESSKNNLDEIIISVGKTFIQNSPAPNKEAVISANKIVSIMKREGLKLDKIGYVFPKNIKVKRAGRPLTSNEVKLALDNYLEENYLEEKNKEITVNKIYLKDNIFVAPDDISIEVSSFSKDPLNKKIANVLLSVASSNGDTQKIAVSANIEEWKDVPVANRQIYKGEVVGESDFIMARMNLSKLPKESLDVEKEVIGKEATRNINKGDVFSNNTLILPPIIKQGEKIKIVYETSLLSAVATGVAMQDGGENERIKIKNDSSNKLLEGEVVEQGLVRVN